MASPIDGVPVTKAMRRFGDPKNQNRVKNRQRVPLRASAQDATHSEAELLEPVPITLKHFSGVMAGLVPAIYVLLAEAPQERRGCPRRWGPRRVTRRGVIARA